jgi:hypothetical protein
LVSSEQDPDVRTLLCAIVLPSVLLTLLYASAPPAMLITLLTFRLNAPAEETTDCKIEI